MCSMVTVAITFPTTMPKANTQGFLAAKKAAFLTGDHMVEFLKLLIKVNTAYSLR